MCNGGGGFGFLANASIQVNGIRMMFFGRQDQYGYADGIVINFQDDCCEDIVQEGRTYRPVADTEEGGINNCVATSKNKTDGYYFEFKKPLNTEDSNNQLDFALYEGASIGVYLSAWIDRDMTAEPSWGIRPEEDNFCYVRLSIGQDTGEKIALPDVKTHNRLWATSTTYQVFFERDAVEHFEADAKRKESLWKYCYHIIMRNEEYPMVYYSEGNIWLAYDETYLYIFLELYDEKPNLGDFTEFHISIGQYSLNYDHTHDVAFFSQDGYVDMVYKKSLYKIVPDTEIEGLQNGEGAVVYDNNMRYIEFRKELNSEDTHGADLAVTNLDDPAYISILTGFEAEEDEPNYYEIVESEGSAKYTAVHPIEFLVEGEEPVNATLNQGNKLFQIGFTPIESSVLPVSALMVISLIIKRRKTKQF